MNITLLKVSGIGISFHGMRLSYNSVSNTDMFVEDFPEEEIDEKDIKLAKRLIREGDSASKFLRFIIACLDITAPRYWWQQFDTYRFGVERLSTSTMHTITKAKLTQDNFEDNIPEDLLNYLNKLIEKKDFYKIKTVLPESFLQRRFVMASYQAIRHMYWDRKDHRLKEWKYFCNFVSNVLPVRELIVE